MSRRALAVIAAIVPAILAAEPDRLRVDLRDDSTARLKREARAMAVIEAAKPMPHSNIGILYGDLRGDRRATGTLDTIPPPWALKRLEAIAARLQVSTSAGAVTNSP